MRRVVILAAMALGALAIPSSALAQSDGQTCGYTANQTASSPDLNPGTGTLVVYADTGGGGGLSADSGTLVVVGACADGTAPAAGFDGGTAEAGAGEDSATGANDPSLADNADAYAVVDGDNNNTDPQGQSDGYIGVSNYENGNRTSAAECGASGPDDPSAVPGSTNSGGCVGIDGGPWVAVPADAPTPMCGNTSGNSWQDGAANTEGSGVRDGCSLP